MLIILFEGFYNINGEILGKGCRFFFPPTMALGMNLFNIRIIGYNVMIVHKVHTNASPRPKLVQTLWKNL